MKVTLFSLLIVLLGLAFGVGVSMLQTPKAPLPVDSSRRAGFADAHGVDRDRPALKAGGSPKVVVKEKEYHFGTLDIAAKGSHDFVFRNAGDAPLKLASAGTSCRCTVSELSSHPIPPGESGKVTVSWKPIDNVGPYEQTATILTNDPEQPRIELTITGRVTAALQLLPSELVLNGADSSEGVSGTARLVCYLKEPFEIRGHEWMESGIAGRFDVAMRSLSTAELKETAGATSGLLLTVTIKPGLPPGPFQQQLRLTTSLAAASTMTLPIRGLVTSDIEIVGRDWLPDRAALRIGPVPSDAGAQRQLRLVVHGVHRDRVSFKIAQAPPNMNVRLGKPSKINGGAVLSVPLSIDIPPGSPMVDHLGSDQGKMAEIVLETTHPNVPKLRIFVRYAVVK